MPDDIIIRLLTDQVEEYNQVLEYALTDKAFRDKLEAVIGYELEGGEDTQNSPN